MSTKQPWHGIVKILSIKHWKDGRVVWENNNVTNLLHTQGEEFIVKALFTGGKTSTVIPDVYYIGLDDRETVALGDTMDSIFVEPIGNGYSRQPIASSGDFTPVLQDNHWAAQSPLLVFNASVSGTGWGPVQNLFLTDDPALDGHLISTAKIGKILSLGAGESVTLQLTMSLLDCAPSTS